MKTQITFEYTRNKHSVGDSFYHFEWCPKYRYQMFRKLEYKNLAEGCIRKAAHEYNIQIKELNVMSDHLHGILKIPLTMTPSKALQLLKGGSSYIIFRAEEKFRLRYPRSHFWSPGAYMGSVGYNTIEIVDNYVKNQNTIHQTEINRFI